MCNHTITNVLRTLPYCRNKPFYSLYPMSAYPLAIHNPIHNLGPLDSDINWKNTHQYKMIQHHIRNLQVLNEIQMQYVKSLPPELKDELLEVYNQCIQLFNDVMKEQ